MEALSMVIEIALAFLALVIAALQWNGELRSRRAEEKEEQRRSEEKRVIAELLTNAGNAEQCTQTIMAFRENIESLSRRSDNDPQRLMDMFDKTLEDYEDAFQVAKPFLTQLYTVLLENEERFPMANGYGRYIDELRQILNLEAVKRWRRINGYDQARITAHTTLVKVWNERGGKLDSETALFLGELTEKMVQGLEPYYAHAEQISALLFELSAKYRSKG